MPREDGDMTGTAAIVVALLVVIGLYAALQSSHEHEEVMEKIRQGYEERKDEHGKTVWVKLK